MTKVKIFRFRVVLFGATSSPFLLNQTIRYHLESQSDDLSPQLKQSFYIDNFQRTYDRVEDITLEKPRIEAIMSTANMPLNKWASNAPVTGDFLPRGDQEYLGLSWDTERDILRVRLPTEISKALQSVDRYNSKRKVVALFSTVYDPIGLLSPVTLNGKLVIQNLWMEDKTWDKPLTTEQRNNVRKAVQCYQGLQHITVPRRVFGSHSNELHVFTDASKQAYGIASYVITHDGNCNLLTSRSRVTPKKMLSQESNTTVPKLELTALLLGCRLVHHLCESQPQAYSSLHVWTDATAALDWIRGIKSPSTYVLNRAQEIRQLVQARSITLRHVPREDNPADLTTKGIKASLLRNSKKAKLWFHGPEWLTHPHRYPPQNRHAGTEHITSSLTACVFSMTETQPPELSFQCFKSITHLVWTFDRLLHFFKRKVKEETRSKLLTNPFQAAVKMAQGMSYPKVVKFLRGQSVELNSEEKVLIHRKRLYLDQCGLVRCRTRLDNSELSEDAVHPILMDRHSTLWTLIVNGWHEKNKHANTNTVVTLLRCNFWVGQMRQSVRKILRQCLHCKKVQAPPLKMPPPAPLPPERLRLLRPFSVTGVDYSGGYTVKEPTHIVYLLVFTCTATRAVALEVTESLTTVEFLQALRRFAARNGMPRKFISDNAATFHAASNFLRELVPTSEVQRFCHSNNVQWQFITPRAPWQGGFYERMVGIIKANLRKALYKRTPTLSEFRTLTTEIENIVNSRPLTYLSEDSPEEPLTPSHLLHGRLLPLAPQVTTTDLEDPFYRDENTLRLRYQRLSDAQRVFTTRWMQDYLTSLRERHQYFNKAGNCPPKLGDLVLVNLDDRPREDYPLAIITKTHQGEDGVVRSVTVRTAYGPYTRSVVKIIPLEAQLVEPYPSTVVSVPGEADGSTGVPVEETVTAGEVQPSTSQEERPKRATAKAALQKFKEWCD